MGMKSPLDSVTRTKTCRSVSYAAPGVRVVVAFVVFAAIQAPITAWTQHIAKRAVPAPDATSSFVSDEFIVALTPSAAKGWQLRKSASGRPLVSLPSLQELIDRHAVIRFRRQFEGARAPRSSSAGPDLTGYFKVRLAPGQNLDAAIAAFQADPHVEHVERIGIHPVYLEPNDTYYDSPPVDFPHNAWHIRQSQDHDIDGNLAWDTETGDGSVIVGVLDTGVRYIHRDLGGIDPPGPSDPLTNGNIWVNTDEIAGNGVDDDDNGYADDVVGYDFVETSSPDRCASNLGEDCTVTDNDPMDFDGHGTATAGCVAAITNNARAVVGVAGGFSDGTVTGAGNGTRIMCLRVGWHAKDGLAYVRMDFVAEAINYAVQKKLDGHNVTALNCSWGSSNSGGLDAAIESALANDIMIIHSAGNSGNSVADFLGGKAGVLNVGATDSADVRSSFSNFGDWVDLAAPGEDIITTFHSFQDPGNDYVVLISGTSFSAPITCGVSALLEAYAPVLSGPEKFDILVTSGDNIGTQGVGLRLNARRALDSAMSHVPSCSCACFADPQCDSVTDIFDVTELVNVAFRNGAPILDPNVLCTKQTTDVDCSGATDILDVTRMVNVAFRNGDPVTEFCDPCP